MQKKLQPRVQKRTMIASQTQDERFSQTQEDVTITETQDERFSQEEENTAEERFSQFTQGSTAGEGPMFEEDDNDENSTSNAVAGSGNSDPLGQTMPTQLSMEY